MIITYDMVSMERLDEMDMQSSKQETGSKEFPVANEVMLRLSEVAVEEHQEKISLPADLLNADTNLFLHSMK
jgi:hypothetical protein